MFNYDESSKYQLLSNIKLASHHHHHHHHDHHQHQAESASKLKPKSLIPSATWYPDAANDALHVNNSKHVKIRFLLFVEDSSGHRSNIFDSTKATVDRLRDSSKSNVECGRFSPTSPSASSPNTSTTTCGGGDGVCGGGGQAPHLSNEMITRMVFGSFPMLVSNNRTAIKVHNLKSHNMVMISNVFTHYKTKNNFKNVKCYCTAPSSRHHQLPSTSGSNSAVSTPTKVTMKTATKASSSQDELSLLESHGLSSNEYAATPIELK